MFRWSLLAGNVPTSQNERFDGNYLTDEREVNVNNTRDWSRYAFAIKTGMDIYKDRTPILFDTFLKRVNNKILIAEGEGRIQDVPVVDVYSRLYEGLSDEDGRNLTFYMATKAEAEQTDLNIEELKPEEKSLGWISDAHKNLPGFRALLETFPYAEWYMMMDDDTYVFLDTLDDFLSSYNSSFPYYFGAANTFTLCDGVQHWMQGAIFAHGGSGILLSRGAILKLQEHWQFCIIRYHDCWAGDVRLGLCLRNEGILLTNVKTFHSNPPNDKTIYAHPCSRPITFHHLLKSHIQKLYSLENSISKGYTDMNAYVNMQHLMADWIDPEPRENTDREGDEFASQHTKTLIECIGYCKNTPRCIAYSFDQMSSSCTLKSKVNELKRKQSVISGVMPSNFICEGPHQFRQALKIDIGL